MNAPTLILGAHRSGTSALTRALEQLGLFVGNRLDPNHESWWFLRLNDWLLQQCGGRWDHPTVIDDLLRDTDSRTLATDYLRLACRSPRTREHLGLRRWLCSRAVEDVSGPWGFKDPRTTFTLPFWLDVFPGARIIHIHRHGVPVASSLRTRHRRHLEQSRQAFERNRLALRFLPKRAGFGDSPRCSTLEGAFEIWREYRERAAQHVEALGERALEFSYEDLVADPQTHLRRAAEHCGLQPEAEQIRDVGRSLQGGRANAFRDDPELAAFAAQLETSALESSAIERVETEPPIAAVRAEPDPAAPA